MNGNTKASKWQQEDSNPGSNIRVLYVYVWLVCFSQKQFDESSED